MTSTLEPTTAQAKQGDPFLTYEERLRTLSEASVEQHFDAFLDIDWDNPDFAIDPTDERWILPEVDVLGGHPWYQGLPKDEQIRIGLYRQANITKVGLQFEQILIAGLMNYALRRCPTARRSSATPRTRRPRSATTPRCSRSSSTAPARTSAAARGSSAGSGPILPLAAKLVPFGVLLRRPGRRGADRPRAEVDPARRRRHAPAAAADHADPRRRGGAPHRLRPPVPRAQGARASSATSARCSRSSCRSS